MRIIRIPGKDITEEVKANSKLLVSASTKVIQRRKMTVADSNFDLRRGPLVVPDYLEVEFINCTFIMPEEGQPVFSSGDEEVGTSYADSTNTG